MIAYEQRDPDDLTYEEMEQERDRLAMELYHSQIAYDAKVEDFARETRRVSVLAQALRAEGHDVTMGTVRHFRDCGLCTAMREALGTPS